MKKYIQPETVVRKSVMDSLIIATSAPSKPSGVKPKSQLGNGYNSNDVTYSKKNEFYDFSDDMSSDW